MFRILFPFALMLSSASAADIDCSELILTTNGYVAYQTVEDFPNPIKKSEVALFDKSKPYRLDICGVAITANSKQYAFKTKDIKTLVDRLGTGFSWTYRLVGVQKTSSGLSYPKIANLSIDLPDGIMRKDVKISGYFTGSYLPADALIGVRINGGKLKPLLYNGSFREIRVDPKMNTLELYINSSKPVLWEKMLLDVKNSRMIFIKKSSFPK